MPDRSALTPALVMIAAIAADAPRAATAQTPPAAPTAGVVAVTPARQAIRRTSREPGQVEAFEATALHAKVGGYVRSLAVDTGDRIEAGQVLAELDLPELTADVRQKQALVRQAEAERAQAEAGVSVAESALVSGHAGIAEAQAAARRAEADTARWQAEYNRTSQLTRDGVITGALLDEARSKLDAATAAREEAAARVRVAEAALAQATAERTRSRSDVDAAAARVEVARANLAAAEVLARYARIVAPFAGVITRRHVHTGHLAAPGGDDPLFDAERTDRVRVVVGVPEVDAPLIQPGDRAEVRLQALDGRVVEGRVSRIGWSLDRSTRTLRAEIDLDNPDGSLRPGLYAYVTIIAEEHHDALTLPAAAVARDGTRAFCVVIASGRARRREVVLGLQDGQAVEIVSGLRGDEQVVAANAGSLADGQAVRVVTPPPK